MDNEPEKRWNFVPIHKKYQREHFDCGYPVLNDYLKKYARQNHEKGIAKTFVAISQSNALKIDGFIQSVLVSLSLHLYQNLIKKECRPIQFQQY